MAERDPEFLGKLDVVVSLLKSQDAQQAMRGDIREVKGQLSIMLTWLQSVDQRFSALMAPVTPPRKPAAE